MTDRGLPETGRRLKRPERICVALSMLWTEPGWISIDAFVERTRAPLYAAHIDLRLVRRELELVEHRSGQARAWTLPGRPTPPLAPPPAPRPRRRRPRPPRPPRLFGIRGRAAYDLGAADVPWDEVAERVGYGSGQAAFQGARKVALRDGLPWPLKHGRGA